GRILPCQTFFQSEGLDIADATIFVALEAHALAAPHLRDFREREDKKLPVFTDDSHVVANDRNTELRLIRCLHVDHLTALARIRDDVGFGDNETVAGIGGQKELARGVVDESGNDRLIVLHVDHNTDRLAVTAAAWQPVGSNGEKLSTGRQEQDLVSRLRVEGEHQAVTLLETERGIIRQMALQCAKPALFRNHYGDRLTLDHRLLNILKIVFRSIGKLSTTTPEFGRGAKAIAQLVDLPADGLPLLLLGRQQCLDLRLFFRQRVELLADFELLKLAQRTQAHVEDRLGLQIRQGPAGHHDRLGLIFLADDLDHLIEIEIGDEEAAKDLKPPDNFIEAVIGATDQHFLAVVQPLPQHLLERQDARHFAARQNVHVQGEARFQLRQL